MTDMLDTTMTQWACENCPFRVKPIGHLRLLEDRQGYWKDQPLKLTLSEYKIVKSLVSPPGQIKSYREIYDLLHYPGFVAGIGEEGFKANVRSSMKRLRGKFRLLQPNFNHIRTYRSFGYLWQEMA